MEQASRNLSLMHELPLLERICSFLAQQDLVSLACVNKLCHTAAIKALYESPDLSRCNAGQLRNFVLSVKNVKAHRRMVTVLDLLVKSQDSEPVPFFETDLCDIGTEHDYRHDAAMFEELFSSFKKLTIVRIYGHSLYDGIKAHWKSLSQSLVELRIYNLGNLSDAGLVKIAASLKKTLKILHIEHPRFPARSLRVGTIDSIMSCVPALEHLGIGLPLENIKNNRTFLEALFDLESLSFVRVPDVDFVQLMMAQRECKWEYLTVRDCPNMRAEDLDAVFKRVPSLLSLDWRFPADTFYEWEEHELKTTCCRRLQNLVLENGFFSDQCLMRILRVTSQLQVLALANCENIHRIRTCCAEHYVIKNITGLLELFEAFEDCLDSLKSVILVEQSFQSGRKLAQILYSLFREAGQLELVELNQCRLDPADQEALIAIAGRWSTVSQKGDCIRVTANATTVRSRRQVTRSFRPRYRARY